MIKNIEDLFKEVEYKLLSGSKEIDTNELHYDSRKIVEGDIFVAMEGYTVDGHNFIEKAIEKGAKGILLTKEPEEYVDGVTYIKVENLRYNLGRIASNYYGNPQEKLKIVGITGTNGKTTTTYIIEELLGRDEVARIGTVEYKVGDEIIPAPNTTPESLDLIKICKKAVEKGLTYLVMEVSSHALSLGRVEVLDFDIAIFTNLTKEHLDFHKDIEDYYKAKERLFKKLRDGGVAVVNIDDTYGKRLAGDYKSVSYGIKDGEIKGKSLGNKKGKQEIEIEVEGNKYKAKVRLLGDFNILNILSAFGCAMKLGRSPEEIIEGLENIIGVPGRCELVDGGQDFLAIVDYAHTADALLNILKTLKNIEHKRLITIFGCGGDRDREKRYHMGEVAKRYSDHVIITSDNPRSEEPLEIIKEIEKAFTSEDSYEVEELREVAIDKGVKMCQSGDILLVAGKGHETTQKIKDMVYDFDDREKIATSIKNGKN